MKKKRATHRVRTDRNGSTEELTERPGHADCDADYLAADPCARPVGGASAVAAGGLADAAEQRRGVRRDRGPVRRRPSRRGRRGRRRRRHWSSRRLNRRHTEALYTRE